MATTVIIPTAGTGSRMGNYTKNLNKALLNYNDKPILGHLIESWPMNTRFIIPVGYLSEQIKDFCAVAYPDRDIIFVDVDWQSNKAGTGYTLKQCENYINGSFWYVPCDTYFEEPVVHKVNADCYFTKQVKQSDSNLYTTFKIEDYKIQDVAFKQTKNSDWEAFTGLMYISDSESFFHRLSQVTNNEFIDAILMGSVNAELKTWLDFGNPEVYQTAVSKSQKFDFSKKDEVTYICNNKVVKWWLDSSVAKKKYLRTLQNTEVFPDNCVHSGSFMAYDFFPGKTLYEFNNPIIFTELLQWLHKNVWKHTNKSIQQESLEFYKTKTLQRVDKFLEKYPNLKHVTHVDSIKVKDYKYYLDTIDWDYLSGNTVPVFLHGDLQFDNIVISPWGEFKIIDWRHEFAGLIDAGDLYYDLGKMAGGFVVNYANIKDHNFNIEIEGTEVTLSIPNIDYMDLYMDQLSKFISDQGWDYYKVCQLIPLIFWNMSPLHTPPFDMFLWYLGIKLFQDLENEKLHQSE